MPVYICLLRGINVGGKRMKMAELKKMFKSLGIADVQTLLASGNVLFQSDDTPATLVPKIEAAIIDSFGFDSKIIMRTQSDLDAVIKKNPFDMDALESKFVHVNFLREAPTSEAITAFQESHTDDEVLHILGDEVFIHFVNGSARSKLNIEKGLKVIGTARNWNTVLKLQQLAQDISQS